RDPLWQSKKHKQLKIQTEQKSTQRLATTFSCSSTTHTCRKQHIPNKPPRQKEKIIQQSQQPSLQTPPTLTTDPGSHYHPISTPSSPTRSTHGWITGPIGLHILFDAARHHHSENIRGHHHHPRRM